MNFHECPKVNKDMKPLHLFPSFMEELLFLCLISYRYDDLLGRAI